MSELIHTIEGIGWYEYNGIAVMDHRASYIDFHSDKLFLNKITNITHQAKKKTTTQVPKKSFKI
jgi:hypothetical protein